MRHSLCQDILKLHCENDSFLYKMNKMKNDVAGVSVDGIKNETSSRNLSLPQLFHQLLEPKEKLPSTPADIRLHQRLRCCDRCLETFFVQFADYFLSFLSFFFFSFLFFVMSFFVALRTSSYFFLFIFPLGGFMETYVKRKKKNPVTSFFFMQEHNYRCKWHQGCKTKRKSLLDFTSFTNQKMSGWKYTKNPKQGFVSKMVNIKLQKSCFHL